MGSCVLAAQPTSVTRGPAFFTRPAYPGAHRGPRTRRTFPATAVLPDWAIRPTTEFPSIAGRSARSIAQALGGEGFGRPKEKVTSLIPGDLRLTCQVAHLDKTKAFPGVHILRPPDCRHMNRVVCLCFGMCGLEFSSHGARLLAGVRCALFLFPRQYSLSPFQAWRDRQTKHCRKSSGVHSSCVTRRMEKATDQGAGTYFQLARRHGCPNLL
jgi:hypothetical protein